MTEGLGRGLIVGLDHTKPELLEVLVRLGVDSEKALSLMTDSMLDMRVFESNINRFIITTTERLF